MNYSDLDNLYKQIASAVVSLGFDFRVLHTGRVDFREPRAPIQIGDLYRLYTGQYLTTSRQGNTCSVHAWLGNFNLSSTMIPEGDSCNDASCDRLIRYRFVLEELERRHEKDQI